MEPALNYIAKAFILPPGCFFLLLAAAFFCKRFRRRFSLFLAVFAVCGMYLMSIAWFEQLLVRLVVEDGPYDPAAISSPAPGMIVVLAGSRYQHPPEYDGEDQVGLNTLGRLRYAVRLHRRTGLPLLVSGGWVVERRRPLAELMKRCLMENFAVEPEMILVESRSRNTHENARFSKKILQDHRVDTVLLVTDSLHMKRAGRAFRDAGVAVIPAPTHFIGRSWESSGYRAWLPRNRRVSYDAMHELIGGLWYELRYGRFPTGQHDTRKANPAM